MLKLEIKLDEEKIFKDGKYDPKSIYGALDAAFGKHRFDKEVGEDGTITFHGNGLAKDYGAFGLLITTLKDKSWFMEYVVKWLWYNSDDGAHENDFAVEDVLYHYTQKESAA